MDWQWLTLAWALILGAATLHRATRFEAGVAWVHALLPMSALLLTNHGGDQACVLAGLCIACPSFLSQIIGSHLNGHSESSKMKLLGCGTHGAVPACAVEVGPGNVHCRRAARVLVWIPSSAALLLMLLAALTRDYPLVLNQGAAVWYIMLAPTSALVTLIALTCFRRMDVRLKPTAALFLLPILGACWWVVATWY